MKSSNNYMKYIFLSKIEFHYIKSEIYKQNKKIVEKSYIITSMKRGEQNDRQNLRVPNTANTKADT